LQVEEIGSFTFLSHEESKQYQIRDADGHLKVKIDEVESDSDRSLGKNLSRGISIGSASDDEASIKSELISRGKTIDATKKHIVSDDGLTEMHIRAVTIEETEVIEMTPNERRKSRTHDVGQEAETARFSETSRKEYKIYEDGREHAEATDFSKDSAKDLRAGKLADSQETRTEKDFDDGVMKVKVNDITKSPETADDDDFWGKQTKEESDGDFRKQTATDLKKKPETADDEDFWGSSKLEEQDSGLKKQTVVADLKKEPETADEDFWGSSKIEEQDGGLRKPTITDENKQTEAGNLGDAEDFWAKENSKDNENDSNKKKHDLEDGLSSKKPTADENNEDFWGTKDNEKDTKNKNDTLGEDLLGKKKVEAGNEEDDADVADLMKRIQQQRSVLGDILEKEQEKLAEGILNTISIYTLYS
jgi:hypothetical protein